MSKKGRINEFTFQKDCEVYGAFRKILASAPPYTSIKTITAQAVKLPCSRYWISPDSAFKVISAIRRGITHLNDYPQHRQAMLQSIMDNCHNDYSRNNIEKVVLSPAPEFFITPNTAFIFYYRHLNYLRQCKKQ